MKDRILITLATGTTGYAITVELLQAGYPVRIFVRKKNERAMSLEKLGAEVALGNYDDLESFGRALAGVKRVYYCYPMKKGMPADVQLFIGAAHAAKVEAVVFMGQWLAEFDHQESLLSNDIKRAYTLFENSGLNVVYYNPGFFADNLISFTESVVQLGIMPSPFDKGLCPWISTGDLARVAAALLEDPAPYFGKKVHPTGPKSIDAKEMAAVYSKVIGGKVRVLPVPEWLFIKAVLSADRNFGYDAFVAVSTVFDNRQFRLNRFAEGAPTDVVKRLTGREPESFETIVRAFINDSPYGRQSFSKTLVALYKFFWMALTPVSSRSALTKLNQA